MPDNESEFDAGARAPEPAAPVSEASSPAGAAAESPNGRHDPRNRRDRYGRRDRFRRGDRGQAQPAQAKPPQQGQLEKGAAPEAAGPPAAEAPPRVSRAPGGDRDRNRGNRQGGRGDGGGGGFSQRLRPTKGGIKVQSKKGFGESWWAKRWISVLENMRMGTRLQRGRTYARSGQVLSVEVQKGVVIAQVQGSRPKPYQVRVGVKGMSHKEWFRLARAVSSQAIFAAKLLSGEMPREIEQAFRREGLSLFPTKLSDLKTSCTCPDWSNPCKHIAAVYYLLGEEFDRDPFLIFTMRGMTREDFMGMLGGRKAEAAAEIMAEEEETAEPEEPAGPPGNPDDFWARKPAPDNLLGESGEVQPAALLHRVGQFPFWRGGDKFLETLQATYIGASQRVKQTISEF